VVGDAANIYRVAQRPSQFDYMRQHRSENVFLALCYFFIKTPFDVFVLSCLMIDANAQLTELVW